MSKILKLAQEFEKELSVDPDVVLEEHDVKPTSYMAFSNLRNSINDAGELLSLLNDDDDLPQWVDELLAISRQNIAKALGYVRSEKTAVASEMAEDFVKIASGKYDHIDFRPPKGAAEAAEKGLEFRKKNKGKGGLSSQEAGKLGIGSGVARATSLKNRDNLNPSTVRRMKSFFSRHEKNRKIESGKQPWEDRGYVAWLLWGGDAGRAWAEKIVRQMDAADEKEKKK